MYSVPFNRRRFARYAVSPMYTPVRVRRLSERDYAFEGHAYDLCEGGVQIELDHAIPAGTPVAVELTLHGSSWADDEDPAGGLVDRTVVVFGNVVWADADEAGPARIAIAFTRFPRAGERDRLLRCLYSGRLARAA